MEKIRINEQVFSCSGKKTTLVLTAEKILLQLDEQEHPVPYAAGVTVIEFYSCPSLSPS